MTGRGCFITLEGGEGVGKSTQIALLADRLRAEGRDVFVTREPGGSRGAEAIRRLLVEGHEDAWSGKAETLLINAARAEHVERTIRPRLASGGWVLCDRFVHSTLAYQGAGKGVDEPALLMLHDFATDGLWPDLTIVLQMSADRALSRARSRNASRLLEPEGRFEAHGLRFHEAVAEAFGAMADRPNLMHVDAGGSIDEVSDLIWGAVLSFEESCHSRESGNDKR